MDKGQWATTHAATKSATTSRGCGATSEPSVIHSPPGSTQHPKPVWFWPKVATALSYKKTKRMNAMLGIRQMLAVATAILLMAGTAQGAEVFTLTSSVFKDGEMLPKRIAEYYKANPDCVGENVSPPLAWTNVPAGTTSFALVMTDPEAAFDHWIAYGIPASVTSFAEGESSKPSEKFVG